MNVFKMAWRNIWRNRRRSLVTIGAMTLALVVELLYAGLVTGMYAGMEDDVTALDSGDVQILATDYLERPSLYSLVPDSAGVLARLEEAGVPATPRLHAGGLGASGDLSSAVSLVGVDVARERNVLELHTAVAEGQWLDPEDGKGVVVGRALARTLDLRPGSELVVLTQGADGSVANDLYTVRGVLFTVAAGLDRSTVLLPQATFRELMVLPEGAHKIILRRPDAVSLDALADQATALAPDARVVTWAQLNPFVAQMLQGMQGMVAILYLIIYVAVAILVLNAMLMAVFERIREFGVLKALGTTPLQVLAMMVLEGLLQATIAAGAGLLLAAGPMWYLQTHGIDVGVLGGVSMAGMTMPAIWTGTYTVDALSVPVVLLFFIAFFSVLYPALKAAWIRPVEAMRHQ